MIIRLILDRVEADKAVLKSDDGQSIIWPKNKLPDGLKDGAALSFDIAEEKDRENNAKKTAKDIINEIIGNSPLN